MFMAGITPLAGEITFAGQFELPGIKPVLWEPLPWVCQGRIVVKKVKIHLCPTVVLHIGWYPDDFAAGSESKSIVRFFASVIFFAKIFC